ncbi:UDP-GlcNAc:undecaprenyl-phosphate GlcNAc-1-phosphate transferase [Micrococcus cohnii]|uniref:UDP-GlcNAc:undecaprenyl-phosphate GlcNAc-1-phosphate transferase n=1 Tax=Micrococcus cohnii TaxID=993416 RepID=A0A7W7GMR0_9MICC|nr:MraY family glycosyltransferase [Micrococcus cohnii]MBB4734947.1 UDP-GlcNAc:undecaprenyl-phosphate GlcNAc-1-phosphate transferase [Micrococcus cohnii]
MRAYLLVIAVTALMCAAATPAVRRLALHGRAYTPRRLRDVHTRAVPKLGGMAMVFAALTGFTVAGTIPFMDGIFADSRPLHGLLVALGVVVITGLVDDLWDLRWWGKLTGQIAAALAVAVGGIRVEAMPVGWIAVGSELAQIALTVFVIVLTMNAINFVDGLDGLAAGVALIGGSAFFVYSYLLTRTIDQFDYSNLATLLMALLVGATAGFLPYNVYPARIFMGETGALLIGLLLSTAAVAVTADVGALGGFRFRNVPAYMPILLPLAVLALPLLDLVTSVIRRTARGSSPFTADRGHLHHKLVDGGYTHPQAVALLWLWSFLVSWGAVSLNFVDDAIVLPVLGAVLLATAAVVMHPGRRRERRRRRALRRGEDGPA